jgi:uncharacterized delta-60 repeat protein
MVVMSERTPFTTAAAAFLGLGLALLAAEPASAIDGALDPSFWGDGRFSLTTTIDFQVARLVSAPDGAAVVVVGTRDDGVSPQSWFWRAIDDDSAAPACLFAPPGGATGGRALAAAFDASGRLVVAGSARYGSDRFAVARFLYPACSLDDSFDGDGYYTLDVPGGSEEIQALEISIGGPITLAGYRHDDTDNDLVVLRLTSAGAPNPVFSGDGWLVHDVSGVELDDSARGVHVDVLGRVTVGGSTYYGADGSNADFVALRFEADGDVDPTFGTGGLARVAFDLGGADSRRDVAFAMAIDPVTGAIVLAGEASALSTTDLAIARLTADGDPDTTFSTDGKLNQNFGLETLRANAVQLDGLGRLTVVGTSAAFAGASNDNFFVARFAPGGAVDTTF